jgi:hypothetical protein
VPVPVPDVESVPVPDVLSEDELPEDEPDLFLSPRLVGFTSLVVPVRISSRAPALGSEGVVVVVLSSPGVAAVFSPLLVAPAMATGMDSAVSNAVSETVFHNLVVII